MKRLIDALVFRYCYNASIIHWWCGVTHKNDYWTMEQTSKFGKLGHITQRRCVHCGLAPHCWKD